MLQRLQLTHQVRPIILSNLDASSYISLTVQLLITLTLLLTAPLSLAPALNLLQSIAFGTSDVPVVNGREDDERRRLLQYEKERERVSAVQGGVYGGLLNHHDLYNQSSDEEEEAEVHSGRNGKKGNIVVRGKMLSISSLDSILHQPTTGPAALPPSSHPTTTSATQSPTRPSHLSSSAVWVAALRVFVLLCIVLVAFSVPCFTVIMSSIGLLTLSILCFLLPPIFYLRLQRMGWVSVGGGSGWVVCYVLLRLSGCGCAVHAGRAGRCVADAL